MTDLLLGIGATKMALSLTLAIVALLVERTSDRPQLANVLWLLVLVTLITPTLFQLGGLDQLAKLIAAQATADGAAALTNIPLTTHAAGGGVLADQLGGILLIGWLAGTGLIMLVSLARIISFNRQLESLSRTAPPKLQRMVAELASEFGLRDVPHVALTDTTLSPMLWWTGGKPLVVLPRALVEVMDEERLRWVVSHELAHLKRHDHLTRWVEFMATAVFWWNPVTWWARRRLRQSEEKCCDALVIRTSGNDARDYAATLVDVIEFLSQRSTLSVPLLGSPATPKGSLHLMEARLKMIINARADRSASWAGSASWVAVALILPLGLMNCTGTIDDPVSPSANEVTTVAPTVKKTDASDLQTKLMTEYAVATQIGKRLVAYGKLTPVEERQRLPSVWLSEAVPTKASNAAAKSIKVMVGSGKLTPAQGRTMMLKLKKMRGVPVTEGVIELVRPSTTQGRPTLQLREHKVIGKPVAPNGSDQ